MRKAFVIALVLLTALVTVVVSLSATRSDVALLTGTLEVTDTGYAIDGHDLDLGPDAYLADGRAPVDLDGDGRVETTGAELDGLVGTTVTVGTVRQSDEDGWFGVEAVWNGIRRGDLELLSVDRPYDVRTINGQIYRRADGPPPWSGDGPAVGTPTQRPQGERVVSAVGPSHSSRRGDRPRAPRCHVMATT